MSKVVQHMWESIITENTESLVPIFDTERPIISTGDMRTWYSGKPCEFTKRSHINFCVFDSTWEATEAFELDRNKNVDAWVKNDHLGFEVLYVFKGVVHKYRPDFIIRLKDRKLFSSRNQRPRHRPRQNQARVLDEWVKAVNEHGGFRKWLCGIKIPQMCQGSGAGCQAMC